VGWPGAILGGMPGLTERVLPESQRRTLAELTDDLDLTAGDSAAKRSAFWTMLALSAVIASAGVLTDSTATVIGAMIIAPLATPIMGIALGIAKREAGAASRAFRFVFLGSLLVVLVGLLFGLVLPGSYDLLGNGQITGRTSPGLLDLLAAVATGFAGAVGLARRDVSAVLPGVAIAISLVPPLAVVGVCLGHGSWVLALGALVLFLSNLFALVLAGSLVFAGLGYGEDVALATGPLVSRRKAYISLAILLTVVLIPLMANTAGTIILTVLTQRVQDVADEWISEVPGASVQDVAVVSSELHITVQTPGDLPPTEELLAALDDQLPDGITVVVNSTTGEDIEVGTTGER
jgi:uncharacterized hydrophobic protein (TIGR00271 family)